MLLTIKNSRQLIQWQFDPMKPKRQAQVQKGEHLPKFKDNCTEFWPLDQI